jgi:hypothetical protein
MFQRHVLDQLTPFVDEQLTPAAATRVSGHLATCMHCQAALERVQLATGVMRRVPLVEAPASIWSSLERALDRGESNFGTANPGTLAPWHLGTLALAAAVVLAIGAAMVWQSTRSTNPWDITRLDASARGARVNIGEWIETGESARATIRIGEIGTVEIDPYTRMQVMVASRGEHRLNLARGRISAQIVAPPRLFFVNTPSSTVVDLGCAYTMEVDEAGVGRLRVTSGWASLEWDKLESLVPAGASAPTRPDVGPGTPVFDDASQKLRDAVLAFDYRGGGSAALEVVLAEARARDTLTLWHLISRVDERDRPRVFDRIVALVPLPAGVGRDRALALDAATLKLWREELAWNW